MGRQQFCDDISKLLSNQKKLFTNLLSHYIQRNRKGDVETTNSLDALNPLFNTGFSINSFKEKKEVRIPVFENVKNLSVSPELDCVRFVCVSHLFQICGSS